MILNKQQGRLGQRSVQVSTIGPNLKVEYLDELPINQRTETTIENTPITSEGGKLVIGNLGPLETADTGSNAFSGKSNTVEIKLLDDISYETCYIAMTDHTIKVHGNGMPLYSAVIENIEEQNRTIHKNQKNKGDIEMTRELAIKTTNGYQIVLGCFSEWCGCQNNLLKEYLEKVTITKL